VVLLTALPVIGHAERKYLETRDIRVIYSDPFLKHIAPYTATCLESALARHKQTFGYVNDEPITVWLLDRADYGRASATVVPWDRLLFDVAPKNLAFETFSSGERLCTWANHELTHVVNMDQAAPEDLKYRRLFGGKVVRDSDHPESMVYSFLTNPRNAAPPWYLEGAAVFMETWMGGGLGRAQGAYDEMVFRSMVRDGSHFYDPLGLVAEGVDIDFRVGSNSYLYGTRFMSYLAYTYSPEKVIEWLKRDAGSERKYSDNFQRVFGMPLDTGWQAWVAWEHEFQKANLERVRQYPTTPHQPVSNRALGSVSRAFIDPDTRTLYAAVRYPGAVAHIAAISLEDGSIRQLQEVKGPIHFRVTSLAFDPQEKILYYTDDNENYRDLMALDVRTGKARMLAENARVGDLVFNPKDKSLWGLRTANGRVTIVRMQPPYAKWKSVYSFPVGEVLYDLDISPDGSLLSASHGAMNGDQAVRVMRIASLLKEDAKPLSSFVFGTAVPESFVFSPDGKYLYGSSYYTGVSNIYRYEIASGSIQALSNAETGFFRPMPMPDGSMLVLTYTGEGFLPARIEPRVLEDLSAVKFLGAEVAEKHPVVKGWQSAPASSVDLKPLIRREGPYQSVEHIELESVYPIVEGYKDSIALGLTARLSDPIRLDRINLSASYSVDDSLPSDERTHLLARWEHRFVWGELSWNKADFYDLFGPTKVGRKGYAATLGYRKPLIYDLPRRMDFRTEVSFAGDLDTLPDFQNVDAAYDKLTTAEAELTYSDLRESLGAVDAEAGYEWGIYAHLYYDNDDVFPGLFGQFDFGVPLPLGHSSIWLRSAAGASSGDRDNPLANAYFGGFGNNYVDDGDEKRYRDVLSLPGFEINEIPGRSFVKSMVEWNLPPLRFERLGTPDFYAKWGRPALFSAVLVTDPHDGDYRRTVYNVGGQIDFELKVMQRWPMMLSIGYAVGFEDGSREGEEFMISFKIL
jgi:sugar lactone lactonase YvrE